MPSSLRTAKERRFSGQSSKSTGQWSDEIVEREHKQLLNKNRSVSSWAASEVWTSYNDHTIDFYHPNSSLSTLLTSAIQATRGSSTQYPPGPRVILIIGHYSELQYLPLCLLTESLRSVIR